MTYPWFMGQPILDMDLIEGLTPSMLVTRVVKINHNSVETYKTKPGIHMDQ